MTEQGPQEKDPKKKKKKKKGKPGDPADGADEEEEDEEKDLEADEELGNILDSVKNPQQLVEEYRQKPGE